MTLHLDKWQKEVLDHEGHFLLCTGRQVGKTTIFSIKAAEYMIKHKGSRIIVVSLTEDQAQLIIVMILTYLEENYKTWIKRPYSKNVTKNKIALNNGSQVLSRPVGNTGNAVRGFTGDVLIIDEASRFQEDSFTAAKPTLLTTGGQIWMCSTPAGKSGYFYDCFKNKHKRFKVFHISSEEVIKNRKISPSWTKEQRKMGLQLLDEEKLDMGELAYAQEFLGMFTDDLKRVFDDKLIDSCCILKRPEDKPPHTHFLGCDIARLGNDEGSFEVITRIDKDRLIHTESMITKKQLTTATYDRIVQLNEQWNFKKIGIDAGAGALGVTILDFLLRHPLLRSKVEAVNNRKIVLDKYGKRTQRLLKEDMILRMRTLMERGVLLLLDDDKVKLSLRSMQYENILKQGQPTKTKIFGHSDHLVEGLMRAVELANQKQLNMRIRWI